MLNTTEWNNAILEIREAIAERERLERALESAQRSLAAEQRNLQSLSETLSKEDEDVRRLEGTSLVNLIFTILGSKEERLDEERQELLAAKVKHDAAQRRAAAVERDVDGLVERLRQLDTAATLQARYDVLLAEKEQRLVKDSGPAGQRLLALNNELAGLRSAERELREAIQAGEKARAGLDNVVAMLESAGNWGTLDLFGGGMIVSAIKHSKLDEAHEAVQEVTPLLQRFERELADVGELEGLQFETGGLAAFADIFIDNLLVDLIVQSRIRETLDSARGMEEQVRDLLARLEKNQTETTRRLEALEGERRGLLEKN